MLTINAGRLKTYTLIILIISSLILWGSLWFEDYHGLSAFFVKIGDTVFSSLINIGREDIQSKYEKIFIPDKIIVNNGEEGHWLLYPSGGSFEELWKLAKPAAKNIITGNKTYRLESIQKSEWDSLLGKRSIIYSFNYPLNDELIPLMFKADKNKINEEAVNIGEMAITKFGQDITFYIKRNYGSQFSYQKFSISDPKFISDTNFEAVFSDANLVKYASMKEAFNNTTINLTYEDRVFAPIFSFSDAEKKAVMLKEVEFKPAAAVNDEEKVNEIAGKVFDGRDYTYFIKSDGAHIFIDERNNTLKISPDGLVEFETTDSELINPEEFNLSGVLKMALSMTEKIMADKFNGMDTLYISEMSKEKGQYIIKMNYTIDGIPIECSRQGRLPEVNSPIEILASKDQIKFRLMALDYRVLEGGVKLSSDHDSIVNAIFAEENSTKSIHIDNIKLVYEYDGENMAAKLPVWMVSYQSGDKSKKIPVEAVKDGR